MARPFDLQALNDECATRPSESIHSIIDLTLASPGAEVSYSGWTVVGRQEQASMPVHEMIEWR